MDWLQEYYRRDKDASSELREEAQEGAFYSVLASSSNHGSVDVSCVCISTNNLCYDNNLTGTRVGIG